MSMMVLRLPLLASTKVSSQVMPLANKARAASCSGNPVSQR